MFAVMNIMSLNHATQVLALLFWSPVQALVDNDVVEDSVKDAITKDSKAYRQQVWIVHYLAEVVEEGDGWQTKDHRKPIILLQGVVMNSMVRLVPCPKKAVHDIFVRKPGDKFPEQESADCDQRTPENQHAIHCLVLLLKICLQHLKPMIKNTVYLTLHKNGMGQPSQDSERDCIIDFISHLHSTFDRLEMMFVMP